MSDHRLRGGDPRAVVRPAISRSASPQVLAEDLVPSLRASRSGAVAVDLGCGRGVSVDVFRAADLAPRADPFELCRGHARRPYAAVAVAAWSPKVRHSHRNAATMTRSRAVRITPVG
jgi:hypothetical protein